MMVNGPDGPINFPDDMSRDDMDAAMKQRYPADQPAPGAGAAAKPAELGGIPNVIEQPSDKNVDISKGAFQGLRDAGEYILGAGGEIDALERSAVEWLKNAGKNDPNPLTKTLNRFGENYGAVADTFGGGPADALHIPNKQDISNAITMGTGAMGHEMAPYDPKTSEGKVMEQFMAGIGGGAMGGEMGADLAGAGFGKLSGIAKKYLPIVGAGGLGSQMGNIGQWGMEQLFGPAMKSNPATSNIMPPVR